MSSPPAAGGEEGPTPTFANALRAEILKLRSHRPTWVLAGFVLVLLGLVLFALSQDTVIQSELPSRPLAALDQALPAVQFVFAAGVGVVLLTSSSRLVGMEYALGTIRVVLGRGTTRSQLVLAKLAAALLLGSLLLVVYAFLTVVGLTLLTVHLAGSTAPIGVMPSAGWRQLGLAVLSCAASVVSCAAVGVGVGAATRSLTGGMVLSILFFPLDNALALVLRAAYHLDQLSVLRSVSGLLLGPTLNRLPGLLTGQAAASGAVLPTPMVPLTGGESLGVVAGWFLVLLATALAVSARRDVLA